MQKSSIVRLIIFSLLLYRISCQVAPIYGNSAKFQTNSVSTSIPSTQATSPYNFVVTPSSLIAVSSLSHQRPFISISGMQKLQTDNNKVLFLLSQITFSATSFTIGLDFQSGSPTYIYSWVYNAPIKFYYMLIDSSFPNTYICGQLEIIDSMTNLGNSPDSKTSNKNLNSWISSNVVSLSATDSKFIYAITQIHIQLAGSTNQYSINIKFLPTSNTNFDVTVNTAYSQKILLLRVSLFIYSVTVFDTYLIKIVHNFYISSSLATGIATVSQSYSGWNVWPGMQLIIGWAGLEFSGQSLMGFQFSVDTSVSSTSLNLQVKNIQSSVRKIQVTLFSISQLKCPNGQTFINVARTQCYTVCPVGTYPGTLIITTTLTECLPCTIANCISCSSSIMCIQCASTFYVSSGSCLACSSNCLSCDSTGCLQCDSGFSIFNDATSTPSLICKTCVSVYNPQCVTCDQTQCLTCSPGYFYRASTSACQLLSSVVCGDSDWVHETEACDDANTNDNDGCSADCKVETDYVCLMADQLESGASFCKYNRNFYLEFFYLEKEVSSNTVHVFFKLQPSTFNFWTQQTVEMLLNPVTIVDSDTGNIQTIPVNSLNLVFTRNQNVNQIELIIDYDGSNMEGSFLQFNIQPSSTGVPSITHLTTQNNLHLKVDSEKSGVYLFSYSQEIYSFQSLVSTLSLVVGLMALMMLVLGCCVPVGKLIVLECLAVVQISYFSLMQFKKIPPTFIGMKNLMFSNGYNEASMFGQVNQGVQDVYKLMGMQSSVISNDNISLVVFVILPIFIGLIGYLISKYRTVQQQKFLLPDEKLQFKIQPPQINPKLLEVSYEFSLKIIDPTNEFFSHLQKANYDDLMFQSQNHQGHEKDTESIKDTKQIVTLRQTKYLNNNDLATNLQEAQEIKDSKKQEESQQKLNLAKIISSRVLYEMSFYGIIVTSYLSWVSIFHSFSQIQIATFIFLGVFTTITVLYGIFYMRSDQKRTQLNKFLKQEQATNKIFPEKNFILTQFGEFSQVYNQITVGKQIKPLPIIHKFYIIFILERLISSILIVMLPQFIQFTSIFLILIYGIIVLVMVIIYRKSLPLNQMDAIKKDVQDNDQINETIRTDLLKKQNSTKTEQQTLPSQNIKTSIFSYLHQNYILRQSINIMTIIAIQILYFYTNIVVNSQESYSAFTKNSLIIKIVPILIIGLLFINMLFNQFLWIWEIKSQKLFEKCRIIFYSICKDKFQVQLEKMRGHMDQLSQAQRQQAEVVKMMNNFMEKSSYFQPKDNPFLGIEEKQKQQANQAFLDLLKIQDKKLQIPFQVKKRKNWLIERYWEYI